MFETRQIIKSSTTRSKERVGIRVQTTDATPTVVYSIPLIEGRAIFAEARCLAIKSDFSELQVLSLMCGFRRASGGNVTKATSVDNKGFGISNGDFSVPLPSLNIVANTSAQTVDVEVTGKAATTINWHFEILSINNLT